MVVDNAATVRMLSQEALELYSYRVLTADSKEVIYTPNMLQQFGERVTRLIDKPQQA